MSIILDPSLNDNLTTAESTTAAHADVDAEPRTQAHRRLGLVPKMGLVAILTLAAGMRFTGLDREGYWGDEYIPVVNDTLPAHYALLNASRGHGLGLVDTMIGVAIQRIHPSVWAFRMPAALCGVIGVAACFFLVTRLATWREGLIAAGLLCLCPQDLILSQETRQYTMALAFVLVSLVLLLRAFEKPSGVRVALYGIVVFLCPHTRLFMPVAFQAAVGLVLTVALLQARRREANVPAETHRALRRLWTVTLVAGLLTLPLLLYLVYSVRAYTVLGSGYQPNYWGTDDRFIAKIATNVSLFWAAQRASYGIGVLALAGLGIALCIKRWRRLSPGVRCALGVMLAVGPVFVTSSTIMLKYHPLAGRYSYSLIPIIASFAAIASMAFVQRVSRVTARHAAAGRIGVGLLLIAVFAHPAVTSAKEMGSYRRRDWRGCAAYLEEIVTADDVVMVLNERPFGAAQPTFHGKHDWPPAGRPLAESLWNFIVSDSHFERLCRKTGRCVLVLSVDVDPQPMDAYLRRGLQRAPPAYRLVKFRGLDVLIRERPLDNLLAETLAGCDEMVSLPREHPSTSAIIFALEARLLLHLGRLDEAGETYRQARAVIPAGQRELFDHHTAAWARPIGGTLNRSQTK